MYELAVTDEFCAAHALRDYNGPCERLHGHNYVVQIAVVGDNLNDQGLLIDFRDLKGALAEVLRGIDHQNLNDLDAFREASPTSEVIARYIYEQLEGPLRRLGVTLRRVTIWETSKASASYEPRSIQE